MAFSIIAFVVAVASAGVAYSQSMRAQKEAEKAQRDAQAILLNREGTTEQIPVVYGTRRVGGVRVFAHTAEGSEDRKNDLLYVVLIVSEGEVASISDMHINGTRLLDSKYNNFVSWTGYTGSDTQTADSDLITATDGLWTANHRLQGLAYVVVKLRMPDDVEANPWGGGLPEITVLVKGKKVYDPRSAQTDWSDNPALCLRDYLTDGRYGKGLPATSIDDVSFSAAADYLDLQQILVVGEPAEKPYACNASLDTAEKLIDNVKSMLLGCKGFLPYSNGQYGLIIDKAELVEYQFTKDNLIGGIKVDGAQKDSKFNQVVVTFANPNMDYQPDQAIYPEVGSAEDLAWLAEDSNERLKEELDANTITSRAAAYNLGKTILLRSRSNLKVSFTSTSEALRLRVGDVVSITHDSLGWVNYPFKIEALTLNSDGTCGVSCREYTNAAYGFDTIALDPSFQESTLPDPFNVQPPTSVTVEETSALANDGSIVPAMTVSWSSANDAFVSRYELQWKQSTDTEYNSAVVSSTQYTISGVQTGAIYNVRVRSVNGFGSNSDWVIANSGSLSGDVTPPGLPFAISVASGPKSLVVYWTNPADTDFASANVYQSETIDGTYSVIANVAGSPSFPTSYVHGGLAENTTYFYKLSAVDRTGNESNLTSAYTATTDQPAVSPRVSKGYVYYTSSQDLAPETPSAASYNYDTGVLSSLTVGWQQDPVTIDGSEGAYWATSYVVTEDSPGGTQTLTFSAPFTSVNFDGLVTFSNISDELGDPNSTRITTINGGLIKTGTIDVNLVNIAGTDAAGINIKSASSGQRLEIRSTNLRVYDSSNVLRVKLGAL